MKTKKKTAISKVSKEIVLLKFKKTDTLQDCRKKFFAIMRKYGIKQGTTSYNKAGKRCGRTMSNFEWTMCRQMFAKIVEDFFLWEDILGGVPKDLLE